MENVIRKCDIAGGLVKMITPRVRRDNSILSHKQAESRVPHHKNLSSSHFLSNSYGDTISKYKANILKSSPGFTASSLDTSVFINRRKDEWESRTSSRSKKFERSKLRVLGKGGRAPVKLRINGIDVLGGKIKINPYRGPKYGSAEGLDHWTSTRIVRNYLAAEDFPVEKHKDSKLNLHFPRTIRLPEYLTMSAKRNRHPLVGRHVKKERIWEVITMKPVKTEEKPKSMKKPIEAPTQIKTAPKQPQSQRMNKQPKKSTPKKPKKAKSATKPPKKKTSKSEVMLQEKKKEHRRLSDERLYADIRQFRSEKLGETTIAKRVIKPVDSIKRKFLGRHVGLRAWAGGIWPAFVRGLSRAKQTWAEKWFRRKK